MSSALTIVQRQKKTVDAEIERCMEQLAQRNVVLERLVMELEACTIQLAEREQAWGSRQQDRTEELAQALVSARKQRAEELEQLLVLQREREEDWKQFILGQEELKKVKAELQEERQRSALLGNVDPRSSPTRPCKSPHVPYLT